MKTSNSMLFVLFCIFTASAQMPEGLSVENIASADFPVAFVSADDGSGRMFIVEKSGVIKIFHEGGVLETPFLDISSQVSVLNEQGLLGLAFAPDFTDSGEFFVYYTFKDSTTEFGREPMKLVQYSVSDNPNLADETSAEVITVIPQEFSYHNGGNIDFGFDGYLYIGTGDDGFADLSQSSSNVYGKIIRIDVSADLIYKNEFGNDEACGSPQNYLVPASNPYINDSLSCKSVYLLGLRNPWRWSFDSQTGNLYIGDVGGVDQEEVSEVMIADDAGGNLGWPCVEGDAVLDSDCADNIVNLIDPFYSYSRISGQSQSVVGGYVYRGQQIPELHGTYLFNDIYREEFYFSKKNNNKWQIELWDQQINTVVSYGEDEEGEVYLLSIAGDIYKLIQN